MKQSLQLRLGQHLTMTPQLQQAIRMLQLSTLELRLEVQQALESNLMLEEVDDGAEAEYETDEPPPELTAEPSAESLGEESGEEFSEPHEYGSEIPDELPVDSQWEDTYDTAPLSSAPGDDDERSVEYGDTSMESLREHLLWQAQLAKFSDRDMAIAEALIDSISEDGLLITTLPELRESLAAQYADMEEDEIEAVLHAIQQFDPAGVAARGLGECLLLQLKQLPAATPWLEEAKALVQHHFDLLGARDYTQIKRKMKLEEGDLVQVIRLIQTLNPRPGAHISASTPEYITPDVLVRKFKGTWRVELNPEAAPRLRVNASYARLIKQVNNASDSTTLKNHLQEARWFIKSLQSRNETLLKVATAIVEHQRGFLEQGEVAMKALVLHHIAEELGMHESTISRVTTRKYMHTPRGVFELKYFFSSHVGTASGGECSSTAIRALIKRMIAEENPAKPLSDSKIATELSEQGINVARRTVAKYREAMAIPPSNERKRLA